MNTQFSTEVERSSLTSDCEGMYCIVYHKLTSTFMTDSRRWTIRFLPTLYSKTSGLMVDNLKKKIFKPSKPIKIFPGLALLDLSTILLSNTNETWIAVVGSHEFPLNKKEFQRPVTRVKLWRLPFRNYYVLSVRCKWKWWRHWLVLSKVANHL